MASLLIKDLPAELHDQLKESARRNRRSMNRQTIVLLEKALEDEAPVKLPSAAKGRFPITDPFLQKAKRAGRS
jgi:plasmid stability protein